MKATEIREVRMEDLCMKMGEEPEEDILLFDRLKEPETAQAVRLRMLVVIYCEAGSALLKMDDVAYSLAAGHVLLCLPRKLVTEVKCGDDLRVKVIGISERLLRKVVYNGKSIQEIFYHIGKNPLLSVSSQKLRIAAAYYGLMEYKNADKQSLFRRESLLGLVQAMIYELLSDFSQSLPSPHEDLMRQGDIIFRKFLMLLVATNGRMRTVGYYAGQLCVSPKYLSCICKEHRGQTALTMIHERAAQEIGFLLKNTEKSIKEISEEMNFPTLSFFGKFVKQHLGMSPTDYRKRISK